MAGGGSVDNDAPFGMKLLALIVIVISATIGGKLLGVMQKGLKTSKFEIKPCLPKKVAIPPLVGMIVFGCIARNIWEP